MAESKTSVVALNCSNYATWKLQCQMALMKENLWSIVNETETAPAAGASAAEVTKFRTRKDRALATIVLSVDPSLLYLIGEPKEPVEVWQQLRSQFQKKSWANKLVLRRRLHSLHLKEGESVQEHIKKMTELFNELDAIGAPMDEEDRVVQLLASLSESYDTLVTALEASENVPSMAIVIDRLIYEEKKVKDRYAVMGKDHGQALTVKNKPKWKKGVYCHYCGKRGHIQKDCYEREDKRSEKRPLCNHCGKLGHVEKDCYELRNKSGNRKNEDSTSIGLIAVHALAADSEQTCQRDIWIIDSGSTCHICCNETMFDKMEDMGTPQIVTLGDGRSIETTKRGTVQLKLKQVDGSYKNATLHDVLYVPELSYNLLSITKSTSRGKTVRFDEATCEILNEDQEIVGLATKYGSLYYLNCKINSQQEAVNAVTNQSNIEMWHQRFGHLNVTSLQK